jgi:N-sulfoglucosamine sulfohydrolase
VPPGELGQGRDPALYYQHTRAFLDESKKAGRPFFLMANAMDPHRPFAGIARDARRDANGEEGKLRIFKPEEAVIPPFLPDIPDVRQEVAQYFTSVHRCDQVVGSILKALDESSLADRTIVMFLSDHGMAFPFAKTNCYQMSTRTPWMVRWPERVKAGQVEAKQLISGIDFMPTVLEALGLPQAPEMDGRSFLPLLRSESQDNREWVYTVFHRTAGRRDYPMRCVQGARYGYIYNAWSDGKTVFKNESQSGLTFKAMQAAAERDPEIAARVKFFLYRVPEEFYDYDRDPGARHNLIDDPAHQEQIALYRERMREQMVRVNDPLLGEFQTLLTAQGG